MLNADKHEVDTVGHFDLAVMDTLQDVMAGEYPELLKIYIADSEQRLRDLGGLVNNPLFAQPSASQLQRITESAHSFKGSSGNMGATRLALLCRELEELGRFESDTSVDNIRRLASLICAEFLVVRDFFDLQLQTMMFAADQA